MQEQVAPSELTWELQFVSELQRPSVAAGVQRELDAAWTGPLNWSRCGR